MRLDWFTFNHDQCNTWQPFNSEDIKTNYIRILIFVLFGVNKKNAPWSIDSDLIYENQVEKNIQLKLGFARETQLNIWK